MTRFIKCMNSICLINISRIDEILIRNSDVLLTNVMQKFEVVAISFHEHMRNEWVLERFSSFQDAKEYLMVLGMELNDE